ncbi:MAG: metal ABC transporter permease [Candidatus Methanomethylicia archaeon]
MIMLEVLIHPFILRAFIACIITSIVSSVIGVYIVLRRLSTIGAAIAHSALAGAIMAIFLGLDPIIGAFTISIVFALLLAYSSEENKERVDITIGVLFGFSAALAILFISLISAYTVSAWRFLIGDVLGVSEWEIYIMSVFSIIILTVMYVFYKEFKYTTFDPEAAEALGLNVKFYSYLIIILIALTAVICLKVVGSILTEVLLVAPAAASYQFAHSLEKMKIISMIIAILSSVIGLILSILLNISASATIGLMAVVIYFISLTLSTKRRKCKSFIEYFRMIGRK